MLEGIIQEKNPSNFLVPVSINTVYTRSKIAINKCIAKSSQPLKRLRLFHLLRK